MSLKEWMTLLLKSGADDPELEEGLSLWKKLQNGKSEDKMVAPDDQAPALASNGHSTRRASIIPLQDWVTVKQAAEKVGLALAEVDRIVQEQKLCRQKFNRAPDLVSCRQIEYWLQHKAYLEVHADELFSDWVRLSDGARLLGVYPSVLSNWASEKKIACYIPHPQLVLVNLTEIEQQSKRQK